MIRLEDYYRTLFAFLKKNTLLCHMGDETAKLETKSLAPALMPLTAFLLASKRCIYDRVDQMYMDALRKPEAFMNIDREYEDISVPELEICLTLPGRVMYQKLLLLLLTWKEVWPILKLIKMAYPLSYTEEEGENLEATLLVGDYDVRNAVITYLVLYLRGVTIPVGKGEDPVRLVYQQFERAYLLNVPLPFWLPQEHAEQKSAEFQLLDLINTGYMSASEPWYVHTYRSIMKMNDLSDWDERNRPCSLRASVPSIHEFLKECGNTSAVKSIISKKQENPNVENRLKKAGAEKSGLLLFLYEILSNAYLSREELLDSSLPEAANDWVDQAVFKAKAAGAEIPLEECQLLAGVIYALLNRIRHAEELTGMLLAKDSASVAQNPPETDKKGQAEPETFKQELRAVSRKNKELRKSIADLKRKTNKDLAKWSCEYESLTHKYENLKHDFEQLIMTNDEDEDLAPSLDDTSIEEMKTAIRKEKLLFVGGHPNWQNAMKAELPEFRFLDPKEYSAATPAVFTGIDFIIYNVKWNNHGMYYKCLKQKDTLSRFVFIRSNNVTRTILDIYQKIEAGDQTDVVE